jgi:RHS repeat-associated protein
VGTCGSGGDYPAYTTGGFEIHNASRYQFNWTVCSSQQPAEQTFYAVLRRREVRCPTGYTSGSGYCYIDSNDLDRAKNLGKSCPTCGNPINPALGNKFQEEVDYEGAGPFPLRFVRYYNSATRIDDDDGGHYGVSSYAGSFGNLAVAGLASADAEPAFGAVGLDLIGANWRHSYQGAIVLISSSTITSARVYRPDGRVIVFNLNGGVYHGAQDVSERLERLPNNGWKLTNTNNEVETYSELGRLQSIRNRGGLTHTLSYDALGQRVRKSNASVTRLFVYDEAGHLLGEYDGAGALVQETVWMDDVPVVTLRPNGAGVSVFYVHTDHLNTPRRLSRPADNLVVWKWNSDPFGTDAANEDPDGDSALVAYDLRFPGQYFDGERGVNYNYFRDYDPYSGRYLQSDPIGLDGGINTYAYVGGNPLSYSDPTGLAPPGRAQPGFGFPPLGIPGPFDESWNESVRRTALQLEEAVARAIDACVLAVKTRIRNGKLSRCLDACASKAASGGKTWHQFCEKTFSNAADRARCRSHQFDSETSCRGYCFNEFGAQ